MPRAPRREPALRVRGCHPRDARPRARLGRGGGGHRREHRRGCAYAARRSTRCYGLLACRPRAQATRSTCRMPTAALRCTTRRPLAACRSCPCSQPRALTRRRTAAQAPHTADGWCWVVAGAPFGNNHDGFGVTALHFWPLCTAREAETLTSSASRWPAPILSCTRRPSRVSRRSRAQVSSRPHVLVLSLARVTWSRLEWSSLRAPSRLSEERSLGSTGPGVAPRASSSSQAAEALVAAAEAAGCGGRRGVLGGQA